MKATKLIVEFEDGTSLTVKADAIDGNVLDRKKAAHYLWTHLVAGQQAIRDALDLEKGDCFLEKVGELLDLDLK